MKGGIERLVSVRPLTPGYRGRDEPGIEPRSGSKASSHQVAAKLPLCVRCTSSIPRSLTNRSAILVAIGGAPAANEPADCRLRQLRRAPSGRQSMPTWPGRAATRRPRRRPSEAPRSAGLAGDVCTREEAMSATEGEPRRVGGRRSITASAALPSSRARRAWRAGAAGAVARATAIWDRAVLLKKSHWWRGRS